MDNAEWLLISFMFKLNKEVAPLISTCSFRSWAEIKIFIEWSLMMRIWSETIILLLLIWVQI